MIRPVRGNGHTEYENGHTEDGNESRNTDRYTERNKRRRLNAAWFNLLLLCSAQIHFT